MWTVHNNLINDSIQILVISSAGALIASSGKLPATSDTETINMLSKATCIRALKIVSEGLADLPLADYYGLLIRFNWDVYTSPDCDVYCNDDGVPYVELIAQAQSIKHKLLFDAMFASRVQKDHMQLAEILQRYGLN